MKQIHALVIATAAVAFSAGCTRAAAPAPSGGSAVAPSVHGIDLAGMDRSVSPGDDFYGYANGAWMKATEIAPDRSSAGVWDVLRERATARTHDLLERAAASTAPAGSDERKAGDYYASYLDEAAIEAKGIAPIAGTLKAIAAIADERALAAWVGSNLRADVDPLNATTLHTDRLFGLWISPGLDDPTRYVPYLLQGGLGLPDREYYVARSDRMESIRSAYRTHIAAMLTLGGIADAGAKAARVFDLESRIAAVHATRVDSEDVAKANNSWTRDEFTRRAPGLDWDAFFKAAGLGDAPRFIVWQPRAITGTAALAAKVPLDVWRDYLTFAAINHNANFLPKAFVAQRFAMYGKTLSGTPQLRDRWKRAVDSTSAALPDPVGKLYVAKFFSPETKAKVQAIVEDLKTAFDRRLDNLAWMDAKTRASAKAKLMTLVIGVGYPDAWHDYSKVEIVRGDALGNVWRAEVFDYQRQVATLGQPVDRKQWWISPQTVNALNLPIQNALNFPAAVLEPPFFDADADASVQYGTVGTIIGHEVSHSFDDQGSLFDASGTLRNWWTKDDLAHFTAAGTKLAAQYDAYQPFPDLHVNGRQTLGENIADLAGLTAAYDAYHLRDHHDAQRGGFSADQTFFLGFGQNWRDKTREAALRQRILTDGHAPDEYRADTARNVDGWYEAFGVKPGGRLYLKPEERVRVW